MGGELYPRRHCEARKWLCQLSSPYLKIRKGTLPKKIQLFLQVKCVVLTQNQRGVYKGKDSLLCADNLSIDEGQIKIRNGAYVCF